jgi:para-aminobenzoate synthetase component 1
VLFRSPFRIVSERLKAWRGGFQGNKKLPPFQGGAAGFFGYDLARGIEKLKDTAQDNPRMPDMALGIYDKVYAWDHERSRGYFMVHAKTEREAIAKFEHFKQLVSGPPQASPAPADTSGLEWKSSHTKESYAKAIAKIVKYIFAGDIFQANFSQYFEADLPQGFDSFDHYRHLRAENPAPFSAYMNCGALRLASCSPERFLSVKDREVETKPIKGTRPRGKTRAEDLRLADELAKSAKDRAENAMIVDLLRNDLSKVCADHSIHVPQLCDLESFTGVHHLVSTITGRLRADRSPVDLLRGCFPGGSITGAPKVRAMEIIEELESVRRGPYCGAIGYVGMDGSMDTNIVIRTLV